MQLPLNRVSEWAYSLVNPGKTEVVLFTRKHRPLPFRSLRMHGTELKDFLVLVLESKLT